MARANRHFIPGYTWHLTHRCHKGEFLLKLCTDRSRWTELLFEARKRFHLSILNFIVTSNHIHLIVWDNNGSDMIPRAMQLIAGRVGQEYNRRKSRKGAFWEDRYHATAIESGDHLWRCMVYIDLNMVRAGVVDHPSKWRWSGYHEIQKARKRYRVIDHDALRRLLFVGNNQDLAEIHRHWIGNELKKKLARKHHFSKSLAVGSKSFVNNVAQKLGLRAKGRRVAGSPDRGYQLRESIASYRTHRGEPAAAIPGAWQDANLVPWNWG